MVAAGRPSLSHDRREKNSSPSKAEEIKAGGFRIMHLRGQLGWVLHTIFYVSRNNLHKTSCCC